jgi:hypothetical protein
VGRIERRLRRLEEVVGRKDAKAQTFDKVLKRLSDNQLRWMLEPIHEPQQRVPCVSHANSLECVCRSDERRRRAIEAYPEQVEEYVRRQRKLQGEVMNEHTTAN